jgi:hypothetical protein
MKDLPHPLIIAPALRTDNPLPLRENRCERCRHWKSRLAELGCTPVKVGEHNDSYMPIGECRFDPPQAMMFVGALTGAISRWPLTWSYDWCGKFAPMGDARP